MVGMYAGCNSGTQKESAQSADTRKNVNAEKTAGNDSLTYCSPGTKAAYMLSTGDSSKGDSSSEKVSHKGMVFIEGGTYRMGASDREGRPDEYPAHEVEVGGFWMDQHQVT